MVHPLSALGDPSPTLCALEPLDKFLCCTIALELFSPAMHLVKMDGARCVHPIPQRMALPPAREDRGPRKAGEGSKENEAGDLRAGLSWGRSLETRFGVSQRPKGCIVPCVCGGVRMIQRS